MKTKWLYASALALFAASCAETEFDQLGQNPTINDEGRGITFIAGFNDGAETKGDFSQAGNVFNTNWFADYDAIGVFYKTGTQVGNMLPGNYSEAIAGGAWMGLQVKSGTEESAITESNAFKFRASASGTNGYFVADGDEDMLKVTGLWTTGAQRPTFRAFWPYSEEDYSSSSEVVLPDLSENQQITPEGYGIMDNVFMVSESTFNGSYDQYDNSVAKDRFGLDMKRVNPIVWFQVKIGDESVTNKIYKRDYPFGFDERYGELNNVTLIAKGYKSDSKDIKPSKLTFNSDDKWNIAYKDLIVEGENGKTIANPKAFVEGKKEDAKTSITTNLGATKGAGLSWADDYTVFMPVANIDRSAFVKENVDETMSATYTFSKIKLQKDVETRSNLWSGNRWVGYPSPEGYKLYEDNYSVYMNGNDYVLEINKDFDLADAFDKDGNVVNIYKADGKAIAKDEITHFVSKVNLTDKADYSLIQSLTNLTHITLLENENLPENAFSGLKGLVYVNLPKVTEVGNNAFPDNDYTDVYMGSYNFEDVPETNQLAVRNTLLKANSLERADISGVSTIGVLFVQDQYPTFINFAQLEEITVRDGVLLATAAFRGCEALTTVSGKVVLNKASNSQFANCKQLKVIEISGTEIPEAAFSGCTNLTTINNNGKAVVPTYIGQSAFAATALTDIDLSQAATIGKSAFEGCKNLTGGNDQTLMVSVAKHISDRAFYGCINLENITFTVAESIGSQILDWEKRSDTQSKLKKIEFMKVFTANGSNFFGPSSKTQNMQLFCNKAQPGVTFPVGGSPKISLGGSSYTFMTIDLKY